MEPNEQIIFDYLKKNSKDGKVLAFRNKFNVKFKKDIYKKVFAGTKEWKPSRVAIYKTLKKLREKGLIKRTNKHSTRYPEYEIIAEH